MIDATGHAADEAARRIAAADRLLATACVESHPSPDAAMDTSFAPISNPEGERSRYTVAIAVTSRDSSHASTSVSATAIALAAAVLNSESYRSVLITLIAFPTRSHSLLMSGTPALDEPSLALRIPLETATRAHANAACARAEAVFASTGF